MPPPRSTPPPHSTPPPRRTGRLHDVILDLGGPPATVEAGRVFAGAGLEFSVRGAGAAIDPATGRLTLPAVRALEGAVVTVSARNAGGVARARLRLTVEPPLPLLPAVTEAADSIAHNGVVFHLAAPRPVGRYVTGDPFVVGPVRIVAIEPASEVIAGTARHGAQFDPPDWQSGFDGRIDRESVAYDPALNIDPGATGRPVEVITGTVIKAVSRSDEDGRAHSGFTWIDRYATLTVVAAPPPEDAFRPPVIGRDTTARFTEAMIRYDRLADLPPVAGMPTLAEAAAAVAPLMPAWFPAGWAGGDESRSLHAARHFVGYGRDMGRTLADAMLATHRAAPVSEKRAAVVGLVQAGLDLCAQIAAGRGLGIGGAITTGRKPVAAYAAALLDDPGLLRLVDARTAPASWGNADRQFLWITEDLIGRIHDRPSAPDRIAHTPYEPEHLGFPEWRENAARLTASLASDYRFLACEPEARGLFALLLTEGAAEAWGDPLPFACLDRFWRWVQGDARNRWNMRADPPWSAVQLPPRWVLVWQAQHRARAALPEWQGVPEQMWPPEVAAAPRALEAELRPDRFQCPNGGEILRVDLRWRMRGGDRWDEARGISHRHRIAGLSGATTYEVQTRAVSTLGEGPWSTNLPRYEGEGPQAVVTTPPLPSPPVNWRAPVLIGTPVAGAQLACEPGLWAGHPSAAMAFRWEVADGVAADGAGAAFVPLPGAEAAGFTPGAGLAGRRLRCVVRAENASGAAEAATAPSAPVAPG